MRRLAATLLAFLFPTLCMAITVTPDYTDMWWNPDESGWGANVIQQGDVIFVTLFVYDAGRNPTWFVAPSVVYQGGGQFTGALYQTTGSYYFQQPFDPASVTVTAVGSLTFNAVTAIRARLTYNVGGIVINKDITRQSWRSENLAGFYLGARQGTWTSCGPFMDGTVNSVATVSVSHQLDDVQIRDVGAGYTCNYAGKYRQAGHLGEITGSAVCDDGVNRFFTATEIQVSALAFAMRYRMQQTGTNCLFDGYAGGIRQVR